MRPISPTLVAGALAAFCLSASAQSPQAPLPPDVQQKPYGGWPGALFLTASKPGVQAVIVPADGGRIARYALGGENVLFEQPGAEGKTLASEKNWFMVGGYQLDIGPETRGIPAHLPLWLGDYAWHTPRRATVRVTSPPDAETGGRLEKEISLDPQTGVLHLQQRLLNVSAQPITYCLWDRTLCRGGGFVFAALNPRGRFPAGWAMPVKGVYDGTHPASPNVDTLDSILMIHAEGQGAKIGLDTQSGWIAYALGRQLFVKRFPVEPSGNYSDGGCTVEVYFNTEKAELEALSPEVTLTPGQTISLPETWHLTTLAAEVTTPAQARALIPQVLRAVAAAPTP